MRKLFQVFVSIGAIVALSVIAEAQSRRECKPIGGSGTALSQDIAKSLAQNQFNAKVAAIEDRAKGKGKVELETQKGKGPKAECSGLLNINCTATVKQKVCAPAEVWIECPDWICG